MNSFNTNAHDFRSQRNCFSMTGCLIFVLLLSYASCRPSETDDVPSYNDGDYTDADDVDWPNFPIGETTTKDHPIIYYKEDIVSEDYDPNKEKKSSSKEQSTEIKPQSRRKYKEISRRNRLNRTENYRYIKPEKVFFDVYPIEDDGIKEDDTKFNDNDINVEFISLVDDNNLDNSNSEEKHMLKKKSKKLSRRHRQRRDVLATLPENEETAVHHSLRHKRHPFYYGVALPNYHGAFYQTKFVIYPVNSIKHPVKGKQHNPVSPVGTRKPQTIVPDLGPRVDLPSTQPTPRTPETAPVWDSSAVTTRRPSDMTTRRPSRRPAPPLVHSGDEDYVPNSQASSSNLNPRPASPAREATRPPSFGIQGNFDLEYPPLPRPSQSWGRQPQTTRRTTTTTPPPPQPQESRGVSACIWAISSCCTQSTNIRYQCFERLGCSGAFWDLNPCAEDIYRLAVEAASQYLD